MDILNYSDVMNNMNLTGTYTYYIGSYSHPIQFGITRNRISWKSVPSGKYLYELRFDEETGKPCEIAKHISINFYGTLITDHDLGIKDNDSIKITEEIMAKVEFSDIKHIKENEEDEEDNDLIMNEEDFLDFLNTNGITPVIQEKDDNGNVIYERELTKDELFNMLFDDNYEDNEDSEE